MYKFDTCMIIFLLKIKYVIKRRLFAMMKILAIITYGHFLLMIYKIDRLQMAYLKTYEF